ncbi:radical SAM protein [Lujinxingia sediminis]|uniref:Radical SAM protein n=1 Tax=Lujinxingia sediminis TaxID=2480984 RepID=A0ABY0CV64_9DELT|nr:radical SAM protein [Lujinxingia sediminis]RVU46675.1 radical SAM protein [Lujinxingia sediminis]
MNVTKHRRIIAVDFYWTRDKDPRVPLGHASLITALRETPGVDVRSLALPVNLEPQRSEDIADNILELAEGCAAREVDVALGAYVWGEELLGQVLAQLRAKEFQGRIIIGGPQISYNGPGLENIYPEADIFVRGYGEDALRALAATAEHQDILGVHWAGTKDASEQARVDLEKLPSPWLTGAIPLEGQHFIRWETQRGCMFRCAFCQHREPGKRLTQRTLGLPRIQAEIDLFCASDVAEIAVLDPIFNMAPHAAGVLERFRERGFQGRLSLQCRAETMTTELYDAGSGLELCLEFGLQTIHKSEMGAIRRNNALPLVDDALEQARRRGIDHEVSLIFGLPEQTLKSFEESVQWCLTRRVPVLKAFPLMLLRGTRLDLDRAKWDLRDSGGAMPMVLKAATFDYDDWRQMARLSEALKLTEGDHPETLEELRDIATSLEPNALRWMPEQPEKTM